MIYPRGKRVGSYWKNMMKFDGLGHRYWNSLVDFDACGGS